MKYAIVYSSKTGNTKMLADEIQKFIPKSDCIYIGKPDDIALDADILCIGFWTDKGTCDSVIDEFIAKVQNKDIFLFGTAGFGGDSSYFENILSNVSNKLDKNNNIIGSFMCQGKMPMTVKDRYEKIMNAPNAPKNMQGMIDNFNRALSHPSQDDLDNLHQKLLITFK